MRAQRLASVLMVLVLTPGLGRAQAHEDSPGEDAWSTYPEARPASDATPAGDAPFEPLDYPGGAAASGAQDVSPSLHLEEAATTAEPQTPVVADTPPAAYDSRTEPGAPAVQEASPVPHAPRFEAPAATAATGETSPTGRVSATEAPPPLSSARDAAASLRLLPSSAAPGLPPYVAPEPLAVPLLRSLLDLAGASAVTLSGAVAMDALVGTRCLRAAERMCILTSFLVTFLSVSGTAPVGAWAVGSLLGGEGKLWAAYIGSAMGMGLGVIGAMPTMAFGSGFVLAVAGPIGAVVGAAIGYEVSHRHERRSASRSRGVTVMPLVTSAGGASLVGGMLGRF